MPDLMGADSAEKGPFAMFAMDIYFHFKISHKGHMHIYIREDINENYMP